MITYESWQDFHADMARISAITLKGSDQMRAWRHENNRTQQLEDQAHFEGHLHKAMGWKASTVQDWT